MPPTTTYPGVYVEEVPAAVPAIAGADTATAVFVGRAPRGPLAGGEGPRWVQGLVEFEAGFGAVAADWPLGLAVRAPRLAVFFLVCGLALIGLPGTLGYCAEDLLFHGALESHPLLGVALPLATALNAVHIMRLFGVLFLGVLPKDVPNVPDVLVRERWALSAFVVFLVACGIVPRLLLATAVPAAETMHAEPTHHDAGPTHHGGSEK